MSEVKLASEQQIIDICEQTLCSQSDNIDALFKAVSELMPELKFEPVLSRGYWYRLGGVVDRDYQSIHHHLAQWVDEHFDGDIEHIIMEHIQSGYFVTRIRGITHYFTASYGPNNADFIQLEIEQLEEVIHRPLVDKDWFPDSLEEFIDPIDFPKLEPEPVGKPYYEFRRINNIADLLSGDAINFKTQENLKRFCHEWNQSSASTHKPFCNYWILALREYQGRDGEAMYSTKPVSTYSDHLPELPHGDVLHGTELAKAISNYDKKLGYPFAWYFTMLGSKTRNYDLAKAVLQDQSGEYEYIPAKDLKILHDWELNPYSL